MRIAYFPQNVARNGQPVLAAWMSSAQKAGHSLVADCWDADAAVIWSMLWAGRMRGNQQVWQHYRARNLPVIVLEVGALRRGHLWRVSVNGISERGNFLPRAHPGRAQALGCGLRPWRQSRGQQIVICCQRSDSHHWRDRAPVDLWLTQQVEALRQHTDRDIVIRPHPRQRLIRVPQGVGVSAPRRDINTYDDFDLDSALHTAWAVVNACSHPGLQAVAQGVPAFVETDSLALPVANVGFGAIEDPRMPDREDWWDDLAWTEWTVDEIEQGLLWQHGLGDLLSTA